MRALIVAFRQPLEHQLPSGQATAAARHRRATPYTDSAHRRGRHPGRNAKARTGNSRRQCKPRRVIRQRVRVRLRTDETRVPGENDSTPRRAHAIKAVVAHEHHVRAQTWRYRSRSPATNNKQTERADFCEIRDAAMHRARPGVRGTRRSSRVSFRRSDDTLDLRAAEPELPGEGRRLEAGLERRPHDPGLTRRHRRRPALCPGRRPGIAPWFLLRGRRGGRVGAGRRAAPLRLRGSRMQQGIELHVVEMPQRGGQIGWQDIARRSAPRGRRLRAGSVLPGL